MTERAAPFHCPYCGEEDLRPFAEGHGDWRCGACTRAFRLKYLGLARGSDSPAYGATELSKTELNKTEPSKTESSTADLQASEGTTP